MGNIINDKIWWCKNCAAELTLEVSCKSIPTHILHNLLCDKCKELNDKQIKVK